MERLLIIADDFTGALDTGIQFAKMGISTKVLTDPGCRLEALPASAQVVVVDAETRPLPPCEAYSKVRELAQNAARCGFRHFYKKTDSALRGNVGSELQALLDGAGGGALYFIPAFPGAGRTTVDGVHYIDGVPVAESVFGRDPFEPVARSSVAEILRMQTLLEVRTIRTGEYGTADLAPGGDAIYVFDAERDEQLFQIADVLKEKGFNRCLAGCSGFAAHYRRLLAFRTEDAEMPVKTAGLICLCGSVNPITRRQLDYAEKHGFVRENLPLFYRLHPEALETGEGRRFLAALGERARKTGNFIIDTLDRDGEQTTMDYAAKCGIRDTELRFRIAEALGRTANYLLGTVPDRTFSMTGGDTLMGLMKLLDCRELRPVAEIGQGAVLSCLDWNGRQIQVISKSGGFGAEDIFLEIARTVTHAPLRPAKNEEKL